MIELKNGETYNGKLVLCDSWMNVTLQNVIYTNKVFDMLFIAVIFC